MTTTDTTQGRNPATPSALHRCALERLVPDINRARNKGDLEAQDAYSYAIHCVTTNAALAEALRWIKAVADRVRPLEDSRDLLLAECASIADEAAAALARHERGPCVP